MIYRFRPIIREWLIVCLVRAPINAALVTVLFIKVGDASRLPLFGLLIFIGAWIWALTRLWRTKIEITDQAISGQVDGVSFEFKWRKLKAVWQASTGKYKLLHLHTQGEAVSLPINKFNSERIMELIRQYVSFEVVAEDSYKQLPGFQISQVQKQKFIEQVEQPLRVSTPLAKWGGWSILLLGLLLTVIGIGGNTSWLIFVFLFIAALGGFLVLASGPIFFSQERILFTPPFRRYEIDWDEVLRIEMNSSGGHVVFYGDGKQLACPGPESWSGKDKDKAYGFLEAQIDLRGIEVTLTSKAIWRTNKNTSA